MRTIGSAMRSGVRAKSKIATIASGSNSANATMRMTFGSTPTLISCAHAAYVPRASAMAMTAAMIATRLRPAAAIDVDRQSRQNRQRARRRKRQPLVQRHVEQRQFVQDIAHRWCVESCTEADQRQAEEEPRLFPPSRDEQRRDRQRQHDAAGARRLRIELRGERIAPRLAAPEREDRVRGAALNQLRHERPRHRAEAEARVQFERLLRRFEKRQEEDRRQQQRDDARRARDRDHASDPFARRRDFEEAVRRADRRHVQQRLRMSGQDQQRQRDQQNHAAADARLAHDESHGEENQRQIDPRSRQRPADEERHVAAEHPSRRRDQRRQLAASE